MRRPCCLGGPGPSGVALGGSGEVALAGCEAASGALLTLIVPEAGPRSFWPQVALRGVVSTPSIRGFTCPLAAGVPPGSSGCGPW